MKRYVLMLFFVALLKTGNAADMFDDGSKFHRTKAASPVYLERSTVTVRNINPTDKSIMEMKRPGFVIKTLGENEYVGYATLVDFSWMMPGTLSISWLDITEAHRRKGYATQAILTIEGVVKAHKAKWPGALYIHVSTGDGNVAMIGLLEKIGYRRVKSMMAKMADFIKDIS